MARDGAKYAAQIASDCAGGGVNGDGNQTGYEGIFDRGRPVFEPCKFDEGAAGFHRREPNSDDTLTSDEKPAGEITSGVAALSVFGCATRA
jgi:hypothetical protein